jgi:acyl carrier protein
MTRDEIRMAVLEALTDVAPEADAQHLRGDVPIRDQVDLDSFDFLNFMIGLHKELGLDVPEVDYPRLATLEGAVEYVAGRLAASETSQATRRA